MTDDADYLAQKLTDKFELPKQETGRDRIWQRVEELFPMHRRRGMMRWAMSLWHDTRCGAGEDVIFECLIQCANRNVDPYKLYHKGGPALEGLITKLGDATEAKRSAVYKKLSAGTFDQEKRSSGVEND